MAFVPKVCLKFFYKVSCFKIYQPIKMKRNRLGGRIMILHGRLWFLRNHHLQTRIIQPSTWPGISDLLKKMIRALSSILEISDSSPIVCKPGPLVSRDTMMSEHRAPSPRRLTTLDRRCRTVRSPRIRVGHSAGIDLGIELSSTW